MAYNYILRVQLQNAAIRCIRGVILVLPVRETVKISPVWT